MTTPATVPPETALRDIDMPQPFAHLSAEGQRAKAKVATIQDQRSLPWKAERGMRAAGQATDTVLFHLRKLVKKDVLDGNRKRL